jgi:hypothetical protein
MSILNSCKRLGGAAAVAASALLITPAPAQADYECYKQAGYQFPGGEVVIHYPDTDSETRFRVVKGDMHVNTAAETFYQNGTSMEGRITGDMEKGGNIINLTVTRADYPDLILGGAIGPDGTPRGTFAVGTVDGNVERRDWDSPTVFACVPGSPPPLADQLPKGDGLKGVAADQPNPAPQGLGTATVTADTDIYDKPDGQGQKIGTLLVGEKHPLMEPCRDDWCRVGQIELGGFDGLPNGTAWVYSKGFLSFSN